MSHFHPLHAAYRRLLGHASKPLRTSRPPTMAWPPAFPVGARRTLWPAVVGICGALVMSAALAAPAPTADRARAQPSVDLAQRYARALEDVRGRRFASAYGALAQLADEGHAAAASMALAMVRHGSSAFGSDFSATAGQLRRWNLLAERDLIEHSFEITGHDRNE